MKFVKQAEERVKKWLDSLNIVYERELYLSFTGAEFESRYARIDFVFRHKGFVVVLEVDEHAHGLRAKSFTTDEEIAKDCCTQEEDCPKSSDRWGYTVKCDARRMLDCVARLRMDGIMEPLLIIRYNPDEFSMDGTTRRTTKTKREECLYKLISEFQPTQSVTIQYAYYDTQSTGTGHQRCVLWNHKDFDAKLEAMCLQPIV